MAEMNPTKASSNPQGPRESVSHHAPSWKGDGTVEGPSPTGLLDADAMLPLMVEIWARTLADSKRPMRGPRKRRSS